MASDPETSPLLPKAGRGAPSYDGVVSDSESTPLVGSSSETPRYDGQDPAQPPGHTIPARPAGSTGRRCQRWPSIVAIIILAVLCIAILFGVFIIPDQVKEYAERAIVIEPTNLSLESMTENGVRARIRANFRLEASRVRDPNTRRIGKLVMSVIRQLGTGRTTVSVYLPDFDAAPVGTAALPPLSVSLVDGQTTSVDIVADLAPGSVDSIRAAANQWLDGKLDYIRVVAEAEVPVRTGSLALGTHAISESLVFEGNQLPAVPSYQIVSLNVTDVGDPLNGREAIGAHVAVRARNPYPIDATVPALGFEVLVPNCDPAEDRILIADAAIEPVRIRPRAEVTVSASGVIRQLPDPLLRICPNSARSPLDDVVGRYLGGQDATLFVRGRALPDTPPWLRDIMAAVTLPVVFPARSFDGMVGNITMADVEFTLPTETGAGRDTETSGRPRISGTLQVTAALPREINFYINVTGVKARADLRHGGAKFGEINLEDWQVAESNRTSRSTLQIRARLDEVPFDITDRDRFADLIGKVLFGRETVLVDAHAAVDVEIETVLGSLVVKDIPADGGFPVKPLPGGTLGVLKPQIGDVRVLRTSKDSVEVEALVNVSNPTPYGARIPHINVHVYENGTMVGTATADDLVIAPGPNTNLRVRGIWDPRRLGGDGAHAVGRNLISRYLSGYNVSVVAKTHAGSIPGLPILGDALSRFNFTVVAPAISLPGDDPEEDECRRFIRDATFHVFSSTSTFTLVSPLARDTIFIERIEAVALYNHTEPIGWMVGDRPFPAPPGVSRTPRLPVEWSFDSIGYEKLMNALGGRLKLDAMANVTIRLGRFRETVWYEGRGIGATVRI